MSDGGLQDKDHYYTWYDPDSTDGVFAPNGAAVPAPVAIPPVMQALSTPKDSAVPVIGACPPRMN